MFWSADELALLCGSHVIDLINERKCVFEEEFRLMASLAPGCCFTLQEWRWARTLVASRNYTAAMRGSASTQCILVPYADLLNHDRPARSGPGARYRFDSQLGAFLVTTQRRFEAGEQVFDSYGLKSNHRYLLNYGKPMKFRTGNTVIQTLVCSQHPGLTQVLASTTTSMNTATAPTLCR